MTETAHTTLPTRMLITSAAPSLKVNPDCFHFHLQRHIGLTTYDVSEQSHAAAFFFNVTLSKKKKVREHFASVSFAPCQIQT